MEKNETSVLVTGVGSASLGREIMKAFQSAPTAYRIIATDMSPLSVGLYEASKKYLTPPATSLEYIEELLKISKKEQVDVIVGGSEPEILTIARNKEIFEENNIKVLSNSIDIIEKCSDKFDVIEYLNSNGIKTPFTILYTKKKDIELVKDFPVIVKARTGSGSRNVYLVNDKEELYFYCENLKKYGQEPIIQEHVGNFEEEYTIGILYLDEGAVCTSIAMKRVLKGGLSTRQISTNPLTNKTYIVSSGISQGLFSKFEKIRKEGEKIAAAIKVNGPINIQCRNTKSGIIPFEINPRFSGTTGSRCLVGYNEPHMFTRYALFGEIPKKIDYKEGYVMKDLQERYISLDEINKIEHE